MVAPCRLPVSFHAIARAIRPPSSGNAGTMLSTNSAALASAVKATSTSSSVPESGANVAASAEPGRRAIATPAAVKPNVSSSVTAGPANGDAELLAGRLAVAIGAHEAAEEEQVDAADPDPFAAGGERVPELVQHDRAEEQERGDDRRR